MEEEEKKEKKVKMRKKEIIIEEEDIANIDTIIKEKPSGFNIVEVMIIMAITLVFGTLIGCTINFNGKIVPNNLNVPSELKELVNTYNGILDNYYEDLDKNELINAGIKGMMEYLGDPYSEYMDPDKSDEFNELVEGKYAGIGSEISMSAEGVAMISKPYVGSPAEKAGLKIGDIILEVDGKVIEKMTSSDLAALVKGKVGTKVNIKIKRYEETLDIVVEREMIDIESVTTNIFEKNDKKIGYIKIDIFANNTFKQFSNKLKELEKKKIDKLIIDVRDNGGGYLTTVSEILSMFMDKSKVLYQLETKGIKEKIYSFTKEKRKIEVAVLINEGSASASEILAGAFKESYNAHIIGVNSYGKGTVQKAFGLSGGSSIKYTIQKWLTPKGNWIDKKGIEPTINIQMNLDYQVNPSNESDNQLQAAINELSK